MNWDTIASIAAIILAIASLLGLFIKCGKLLQKIEDISNNIEENKEKSIESDKIQNSKIDKNKEDLEDKLEKEIEKLSELLLKQIESNTDDISDIKFDFNSFKYEMTTKLLVSLKDNMADLVAAEIARLRETDLSYLSENIEDTKETLEAKIDKLEKKIENIEYKDILPIKESIAKIKKKLKEK